MSYLYVDAQYLRSVIEQRLVPYIGAAVTIDWQRVLQNLGADRAFYYDSIDDLKKQTETDEEFNTRLARQQQEINSIASLDGYFVRLGSIRGDAKKRRQKEVDVLLAVDMLTHSHRKNMERAILISGDMDFKPVVEAVVEQGTFVTVVHDAATASHDLARVADSRRLLTLSMLWSFTTESNGPQSKVMFPWVDYSELHTAHVQTGTLLGSPISLSRGTDKSRIDLSMSGNFYPDNNWAYTDESKLLQFVQQQYGPITWD